SRRSDREKKSVFWRDVVPPNLPENADCLSPNTDKHSHRADIARKNDMHRYQQALWGLLATLLLAACAATQTGADSPTSGTSFAIDPTLAPATSAAARTDAAP